MFRVSDHVRPAQLERPVNIQLVRKIGPLSARQRNAISMAFAVGPILARDWMLAGYNETLHGTGLTITLS